MVIWPQMLAAGLPLGTLARLDRVLRSAARLLGRLPKFSPVTAYTCVMYYTLAAYISQRVIVYSIVLLRWSPGVSFAVPFLIYLRDLCCPVSVLAARLVLRSAARGE